MSSAGQLFLQVAFDRFDSPDFVDIVHRWKINLDDVETLKRTSSRIQLLFDEAEVKQFTSVAVKLWLKHLKPLLYDVEDILDEYSTELLQLKFESEYHETHPHQTQREIKRLGSSEGRDVTERLKRLTLDPDQYQNNPQQTQQVCNDPVPLTQTESSVSSLRKSGIESAVKDINERLGSKLRDINGRLKSVEQEGVDLGLNLKMGSGPSWHRAFSQRPPTSSLVISSKVFGRDEDREKIVKWLLTPSLSDRDKKFSVLPIVGMGGVGKTTLAQLVYNDETVDNSKYFDLKAWVCVSEDFDVPRLTKEILESATGSSSSSNSLDVLQMELKQKLNRKRFLLVLDDMWNENYERWEALSTPFAFGKPGSKILVTTRSKSVSSSILGTDSNNHDLKGLSDEACLDLVRRHAFVDGNSFDANEKLEAFGQEILKKCKGLPLAVKTLAGLLRGKKEKSEWENILENQIWDLRESGILPSLMLSYHHLPSLLKRCFAYCALFPKDYVFSKIELVMLWMAEGLVQSKGRKRLEDIGGRYFDELCMRSFFELSFDHTSHFRTSPFDVDLYPNMNHEEMFCALANKFHDESFFESFDNAGSGFVMHDLIHDLAQFVSNGIYCRRENDQPSQVLTTTRHLSYLMVNGKVEGTESAAMKSLHTLMCFKVDLNHLPTMQFQFLRVLRLRNNTCHNPELLDSIGRLKHLRLLDLSYSSSIVRLPNSITSLYNLQILILTGCRGLRELPEDMGKLINLRHLCHDAWLSPSSTEETPLGVGTLTNLQTLTRFVVGSKNNYELRDLSPQLRGTLEISKLENVGRNINGTNLKNMPHILGLGLRWSEYESGQNFCDLGRDEKAEEDLLDQLQPHTNLESLWIEFYGGTRIPEWIKHPSCFSNLGSVFLHRCYNCWFLPHLRRLPMLKFLYIRGCSAINILGSDELSPTSTDKQFRSLVILSIKWIDEWEEWPQVVEEEDGGQFPCLRDLTIEECPKLKMFPHHFPVLETLNIENCNDLRELPQLLPSLRRLCIQRCSKVMVLPSLPAIEMLYLVECDQITTLPDSGHRSSSTYSSAAPRAHNSLPCLRELDIENCPNLEELPSVLPSLESLTIVDCTELCFLPMLPSIKALTLKRCKGMLVINNIPVPGHLASLSSLTIGNVSDLESLPDRFMQQLTALQTLHIYGCDNLRNLPQSMCHLLCLQRLTISRARNLTSLPEGLHNLTSLRDLKISECENLESLPKELPTGLQNLEVICCKSLELLPEGLHNLTSLRDLKISECENLESLPKELPTGLQNLEVICCKSLELLPEGLHKLMSLQKLQIHECPALDSFPDMGLPTVLRVLLIEKCEKLKFLPNELHKLTNLQELKIVECSSLMDCNNPEPLLCWGLNDLTSLSSLAIGGYPALISLRKGLLPRNIQKLRIVDCPILESLHDGLSDLNSLKELDINNCPILTQRLETKEREEWSKIAQIAIVSIDGRWRKTYDGRWRN